MPETYRTEPIDVMGEGTWNGHEFTSERVQRLLTNYEELSARGLRPYVDIEHDEDAAPEIRKQLGLPEAVKLGMPGLGEAVECRMNEKTHRLQTVLGKLPEKLAKLVREGRYPFVSLEIMKEWLDSTTGKVRHDVIAAVKLLPKRWPGYLPQAESGGIQIANGTAMFAGEEVEVITVTYADDNGTVGDNNGTGGGEQDMADLDLQKQIDDLKTRLDAFEGGATAEELTRLYGLFGEDIDSYEAASEHIAKLKAEFEAARSTIELQATKEADEAEADAETRIDETLEAAVENEQIFPKDKPAEKAVLMGMDYKAKTLTFADGDGKDVEGSELDRGIAALARRGKVVKLGDEGAGADGDEMHGGKPKQPEETAREGEVREGFGLVQNAETGEWELPAKDDDK